MSSTPTEVPQISLIIKAKQDYCNVKLKKKNGEKRHQAKNLISAPGHKCDHRGGFDGKSNPLIGL